ncbi:MAG: hypothetical protein QXI38_05170, partial [Conexivisphaerales archaeon]
WKGFLQFRVKHFYSVKYITYYNERRPAYAIGSRQAGKTSAGIPHELGQTPKLLVQPSTIEGR